MLRTVCRRCCELADLLTVPEISSSQLAKQIWKSSRRSIRSVDLWSNFSKQVISNSPYLTPRDVSVIIHSFAKVNYKDDKMLNSIVPSILKHANEFSVRELVTILSSFRKLEVEKSTTIPSSCIQLLVNEISLRSSEWTPIDVPLIANSVAWFSIFDDHIWKQIERKTMKLLPELSPLGMSLIVSSYAKLDMRNERVLNAIVRAFVRPSQSANEPMKQESLASLINGFAKLDWNSQTLSRYIETELVEILCQIGPNFFDTQSKILILHAYYAHRYRYLEDHLSESEVLIFDLLTQGVVEHKDSLSSDQREKVRQIIATMDGRKFEQISQSLNRLKTVICSKEQVSSQKLPRWEYEVFRILRDKMDVKAVKRKIFHSPVITFDSKTTNDVVVVNCLGPFQHYTGSTKRTSASWIRREVIRWELERSGNRRQVKFIEIPFYIWNELKTDKDKIMFLMARGRQLANNEEVS